MVILLCWFKHVYCWFFDIVRKGHKSYLIWFPQFPCIVWDPNKSLETSARLRFNNGLHVKRTLEWTRTPNLLLCWPCLLPGSTSAWSKRARPAHPAWVAVDVRTSSFHFTLILNVTELWSAVQEQRVSASLCGNQNKQVTTKGIKSDLLWKITRMDIKY